MTISRRYFLTIPAATPLAACEAGGSFNSKPRIPEPANGQGLVFFYRPSSFAGSVIRFNIDHSSGPVGQLTSGAVLYKNVPPGPQSFWAQVLSQDGLTINVSAGQTYYVRGDFQMGLLAGRPKFTLVSAATARSELGIGG